MKTVGSKIYEYRKQRGMTQETLADQSAINLRTLQRIEKGESSPRSNTLKNICNALEIEFDQIFDPETISDLEFIKYFHLSALSFTFIPFGNIVIPMILWKLNKRRVSGLKDQALNLLNFQVMWSIIVAITYIVFMVVMLVMLPKIVYPMLALAFLIILIALNVVLIIRAFAKLRKGEVKMFYYSPIHFFKDI